MSDPAKYKVMVGANLVPDTKYYRCAGLVLTDQVKEFEVTSHQAVELYLDPRIIKASIPQEAIASVLNKREPTADPKDQAIQGIGAAGAAAVQQAAALKAENDELKARLSKLERERTEKDQRDAGRKQRL